MNASAQAFIERLDRHDIRHMDNPQPDGSHFVAVELAGENHMLYNVVMVFSPDGMEFKIRVFQLGKVPPERERPMLRTLNRINADYAWLRFYIDSDGDVAAASDTVITTPSAPRVCWEMLRRTFSVLDEVGGKIDEVLK